MTVFNTTPLPKTDYISDLPLSESGDKNLPVEMWFNIFKHLNFKDLKSAHRTCKHWKIIILDSGVKFSLVKIFSQAQVYKPTLIPTSNHIGFNLLTTSFRWAISSYNKQLCAYNISERRSETLGSHEKLEDRDVLLIEDILYVVSYKDSQIYSHDLKKHTFKIILQFKTLKIQPILFKNDSLGIAGILISDKIKIFKDSHYQGELSIPRLEGTILIFKHVFLLNNGTLVAWSKDNKIDECSYVCACSLSTFENNICSLHPIYEKIDSINSNGTKIIFTNTNNQPDSISYLLNPHTLALEPVDVLTAHTLNVFPEASCIRTDKKDNAYNLIYKNDAKFSSYRILHKKIQDIAVVCWQNYETKEESYPIKLNQKQITRLSLFLDHKNENNACLLAFTPAGVLTWDIAHDQPLNTKIKTSHHNSSSLPHPNNNFSFLTKILTLFFSETNTT